MMVPRRAGDLPDYSLVSYNGSLHLLRHPTPDASIWLAHPAAPWVAIAIIQPDETLLTLLPDPPPVAPRAPADEAEAITNLAAGWFTVGLISQREEPQ